MLQGTMTSRVGHNGHVNNSLLLHLGHFLFALFLCRWQQTECLCVYWSWNGWPTATSGAHHDGCLVCHCPQEVAKVNWKAKIPLFTDFTYCSLGDYYVLSCLCGIYLLLFSHEIIENFIIMRRFEHAQIGIVNVYRKWKCAVYIPLDLRRYPRYRNHSDHPIIRFPRALCANWGSLSFD